MAAWLACFVCPRCRGELATAEPPGASPRAAVSPPHGLSCAACRLVYPVVDGVPYLIEEQATPA